MGIDFSKFSPEFKAKYEEALKESSDGGKKITKKEFEKFSAADQKKLVALISGDTQALGDVELDKEIDIKFYQTQEDGTTARIVTYSGQKANEGLLDLTPDTISRYPDAKMGYLDRKGVVTLYDKSGKAITDKNGKKVQFNFGEAESKSSLAAWYMENNGGKFNIETLTAYQNLDAKLDAMTEVDEDYATLMREIDLAELKNASEDQKASFFERLDAKVADKKAEALNNLKQASEMFQDAVKNGGGQEIIGAIFAGIGPTMQLIDNSIGLTKIKEFVKDVNFAKIFHTATGVNLMNEYLEKAADDGDDNNTTIAELTAAFLKGLTSFAEKIGSINAIADTMTEAADDGDNSNLSGGELTVELIKGAGRGLDSFIGTQGVAFMGGLAGAVEAGGAVVESALANPITREAAKAIVGEIITAYFTYEGAYLAYEGIKEAVLAETKEQGGVAGEKLGMAAFMLGGGLRMGKKVFNSGVAKFREAKIEKIMDNYRKMEPDKLIEELGTEPIFDNQVAIRQTLREKGYTFMERPTANGSQTLIYTPDGKVMEVKVANKLGVSNEFIAEFDKCRSTQDLEALVRNAKTPEECNYIIEQLNSKPKVVNQSRIEDIIEYAKFKANSLRVDKYYQSTAIKEEVLPDGTKVTTENGRKTKEITPDGTERRFNAYDETLEFKPDKTFVKYDKEGNVIGTDVWEEINGSRMTLDEAKSLWTGDHTGHLTLKEGFYQEIEAFIKAKDSKFFGETVKNNNIVFLENNGIKVLETESQPTGVVRDYVDAQHDTLNDNIIVVEYNGRAYRCHCKEWNPGRSEQEIIAMFKNQIEGNGKFFDKVEPQKEGVIQGNGKLVFEKEVNFKETALGKIKTKATQAEPAPTPVETLTAEQKAIREAAAKAKANGSNTVDLRGVVEVEGDMLSSIGESINDVAGFNVTKAISKAEARIAGEPTVKDMGNSSSFTTYRDANGNLVKMVARNSNGRTETTYSGDKTRPDITMYSDGQGNTYGVSVGNVGERPICADRNGRTIPIRELNELNEKALFNELSINDVTGFDVGKAIADAEARISGEPKVEDMGDGNLFTTYKDAKGNEVKVVGRFTNGRTETIYLGDKTRPAITQYADGKGNVYGTSVGNVGERPICADANGRTISIKDFNDMRAKAANAEPNASDFRAVDVITPETQAEFTQFARQNNLRMEYSEHGVTFRDANNHIRRKVLLDSEGNIVKDNYPRGQEGLRTNTPIPVDAAKVLSDSEKMEIARRAVDKYMDLKDHGKDAEAKAVLKQAVEEAGEPAVREAATSTGANLYQKGMHREMRALTDDMLRAVGDMKEVTAPEGMSVEAARTRITELQQQLKQYGAGLDRYDQIHMDRIQEEIRALREIAPLDKTNLEEVLNASPEEVFTPTKADNIKGQGISFKPTVPTDPEALANVTYKAVPLYTKARTVEEMITIAKRDGVKIEMVQDTDGNFYPAVKAIWSKGGYFKLDRDSYVVEYGEIDVESNKDYIDMDWAEKNKYKVYDGPQDTEGRWVIKDCAIVAADKKTTANIMDNSYVHADGTPLTRADKTNWNGFKVHKDPEGRVNAVAYPETKQLNTLEGPIETDVTMGDVEGNVYNKYNDLKKQITKGKIEADPKDPNSQVFVDLVKAGKDEEAIALLKEVTQKTIEARETSNPISTPSNSSSSSSGNAYSSVLPLPSSRMVKDLSGRVKNVAGKVAKGVKKVKDALKSEGAKPEAEAKPAQQEVYSYSIEKDPNVAKLAKKGLVITESEQGTSALSFSRPSVVKFTYDGVEYYATTGRQYSLEEANIVSDLLNMTNGKPTQHGLKFYRADNSSVTMYGMNGNEVPNPWESFAQKLENNGIKVEETHTGGIDRHRDVEVDGNIGFFYRGKYYEAYFDKMFGSKEEVQAKLLDLIKHDDSSVRFYDNQHKRIPNPILEKAPDPKNRIKFGLEDASTADHPQSAEVPTPVKTPQQTSVSGNFKQPQTQEIISAVEAKVAKGEPLTQELINETIRETFAKTENPDVNDMIRVMDDIKGNWSRMPEVYKNDIPNTLKDIDDIYSRAKNDPDLKGVTEKDVEALKRRIMQEPDLLVRTSAVNGQGSYNAVVQLLKDQVSAKTPAPQAARNLVGQDVKSALGVDIQASVKNVNARVVTSEPIVENGETITYGKDANGNIIKTTTANGTIYVDGENTIVEMTPHGKHTGYTVSNGKEPPVITDRNGVVTVPDENYYASVMKFGVEDASTVNHPETAETHAPQAARNLVGQDVKSALGIDIQASVNNVNSRVVSSEPVVENGETVTYGKDANGNIIKTTTANGTIYVDGENTIVEMTPHGKHTGYTVSNGKEPPVITDRNGVVTVPDENYYASVMKFGVEDAKTTDVTASNMYQQLQEKPLTLRLKDTSSRKSSNVGELISDGEIITPNKSFHGKRLQIPKPIIVDGQANFRLSNRFELKLNSPEIKNVLDGLKTGEEISIGREGDIRLEDPDHSLARKHIKIKKLSDNQFEVTPLGQSGTEIGLSFVKEEKLPNGANKKSFIENGKVKSEDTTYTEEVDLDPKSSTGDSGYKTVTRHQHIEYNEKEIPIKESYHDGYIQRQSYDNGKPKMIKIGSRPALRFDENNNPIKPYPEFDVDEFIKEAEYLINMYKK